LKLDQLRAWAKQQRRESGTQAALPVELTEQVRRLRREVAVLRQEQAFARKEAVYFAKESRSGTP